MSDACCGPQPQAADTGPGKLWQVRELQCALTALVLLLLGWLIAGAGQDRAATVVELVAVVAGAVSYVPGAVRNALRGRIGIGTLMTIAAVGAVALGQITEAALLGILFSVAEGLEHYAVTRTRRGLRALLSLVPPTTSVLRDGVEITVAPAELVLGDLMLLRPGERAATDGTITSGRTTLDVSAITGESVPLEAGPGSSVFAGAINGGGAVEVTVTAQAADSSLARIVHIVEDAQDRKGAGQRLADRIARPLVPAILALATAVAVCGALLGDPLLWLERALVVLVAASPCALAIAVPLTVVAAIGAASRQGALVKGGAALEELGRIRVVALDKTGTLTRNDARVVDVATVAGEPAGSALDAAATLEARSEHPLGRAIILAAAGTVGSAEEVTAVPGRGIHGRIGSSAVRLGKPGWIEPGSLAGDVARMQAAGATVVVLERDGAVRAAIAVRDELRPEAPEAVRSLRRLGVEIAMLTGDNERTADALARAAGIGTVHAELLPEDKARLLSGLSRGRSIAMLGDGVNDAPALATADVGIAMGAMGTDVAIETADVALMGEDLRHLPQLLDHARRARRIMVQNIALSMVIIGVLIPLAAFGVLGLATVVFVHESAEVLVILNAIRAARARSAAGLASALPASSTALSVDTGPAPTPADPYCPPPGPPAANAVGMVVFGDADSACDCCTSPLQRAETDRHDSDREAAARRAHPSRES